MPNNYEYTTTLGSTGRTLEFTVSDENGTFPLTGWSAVLNVTSSSGTAIITDEPCTPAANQTTNEGELSVDIDFTTAEYPNLTVTGPAAYHKIRLTLTDPSGDVSYYPGTRTVGYGKLYVLAP